MSSEPTVSDSPDYKSFKFVEENEGMKEAKADNKCGFEDFRVSDSLPEEEKKGNGGTEHALPNNDSVESRRRKGHCAKTGSMEYELPELVVFLQESSYRFVNDICIEKNPQSQGKCLVENCELDHRIISCILESGVDGKTTETRAQMINGTKLLGSTFDATDESTKEISPESLLLVGEVRRANLTSSMVPLTIEEKDDAGQISNNIVVIPKEVERRKNSCDSDLSLSTTSGTEELLLSPGSRQQDLDPGQVLSNVEDGLIMSRGLAESKSQSHQSFSEESSLFASSHISGLVSSREASSPSFRCASHRSVSSTTSSRSFAFPVLASEWHGSPERMVKPDNRKSKKRERRCVRFLCCKF